MRAGFPMVTRAWKRAGSRRGDGGGGGGRGGWKLGVGKGGVDMRRYGV